MLTLRIRSIATVLFKLAGLVIATFVFILLMAKVCIVTRIYKDRTPSSSFGSRSQEKVLSLHPR